MNNCGTSPLFIPTTINCQIRNLDAVDVAATNISCDNLTIAGEPVSNVLQNIGESSPGQTVFTGDVEADSLTSIGAVTAASITSTTTNAGALTASTITNTGSISTLDLGVTGTATFSTNITQTSGTASLKATGVTTLGATGNIVQTGGATTLKATTADSITTAGNISQTGTSATLTQTGTSATASLKATSVTTLTASGNATVGGTLTVTGNITQNGERQNVTIVYNISLAASASINILSNITTTYGGFNRLYVSFSGLRKSADGNIALNLTSSAANAYTGATSGTANLAHSTSGLVLWDATLPLAEYLYGDITFRTHSPTGGQRYYTYTGTSSNGVRTVRIAGRVNWTFGTDVETLQLLCSAGTFNNGQFVFELR